MTEFRVWAPKPELVRLDVEGGVYPMRRTDDGWWHTAIETAPAARYGFLLDDDPKVLPDPRSARQPDGVHARSQLWNPAAATWTDGAWTGRSVTGAVIYELHVGTFTAAGTFDSAIEKLDYLVDLGIDFVELMPVNSFAGTHGWGYDGVLWYSVHEPYGGPAGLVRFVDACHARGLGVLIDAVFNHLGPSGNYLPRFGPYLSSASNPWGGRHQYRRRRLGRGSPLHHRRRAALDARIPCRRSAAGRRPRVGGHHRSTHPRRTGHRDRLAVKASRSPAVAGRRERPQRSAADHPARWWWLRDHRAMGRRHPSRDSHSGFRGTPGLLCGLRRQFRFDGHAGTHTSSGLLPRRYLFVVPAPPPRTSAGHGHDSGHPSARLHLHP
ncbi:hypothetical protein YM3MPS_23660 [Mycobacterium pseudoshottsii]|nr:hypothetical protein YM3MPS_23660 [Mycobacterium pseudoshottsii]